MKRLVMLMSLLSVLAPISACTYQESKEEYSPNLTETATVVDLVYTPRRHGSGDGVGLTTGGDLAFTSTSVTVPERYAVVFQCQHGKFIIENDQEQTKALWNRLKEGQEVTVTYREVYRLTYMVKDGQRTPLHRELKDYDFINATPK